MSEPCVCAFGKAERQKDHGADQFSMRQQHKNYYQFAQQPKALLKTRLDTIAIVPASMLPFQKTLQALLSALPQGTVLLCHAEEDTRQRELLERLEKTFRQQGYAVRSMSMEQVYTRMV